jgi:hypothetical protein
MEGVFLVPFSVADPIRIWRFSSSWNLGSQISELGSQISDTESQISVPRSDSNGLMITMTRLNKSNDDIWAVNKNRIWEEYRDNMYLQVYVPCVASVMNIVRLLA